MKSFPPGIWVHIYATKKPDMDLLYQSTAPKHFLKFRFGAIQEYTNANKYGSL